MNIFAFSEVLYSIGCESAMVFQPCTKPRENEAASCDCTEGRGRKLLVTWGLNILYKICVGTGYSIEMTC